MKLFSYTPRKNLRCKGYKTFIVVLTLIISNGLFILPARADKPPVGNDLLPRQEVTIKRVVDGDTIKVNEFSNSIRLGYLDAREIHQPGGEEDRDYLKSLLGKTPSGKFTLEIIDPSDAYHRVVGILSPSGSSSTINEELISSGHAYPFMVSPPLLDQYTQAFNKAQTNKLGLWDFSNPDPLAYIIPQQFRKFMRLVELQKELGLPIQKWPDIPLYGVSSSTTESIPVIPIPTPSTNIGSPSHEGNSLIPVREPQAGLCVCPYDLTVSGDKCNTRSAYNKPGGTHPKCYI